MARILFTICGVLLLTSAFAGCQADNSINEGRQDVREVSMPPTPSGPANP
jgi:hypothetical protein